MNTNYPDLAPCGIYCGACPSFERTCKGCACAMKNSNEKVNGLVK